MAKKKAARKKAATSSGRKKKSAKKKSAGKKKAQKKGTATKNSLVANINRRKKAGTSRSKADSTISAKAYRDMQEGWSDE